MKDEKRVEGCSTRSTQVILAKRTSWSRDFMARLSKTSTILKMLGYVSLNTSGLISTALAGSDGSDVTLPGWLVWVNWANDSNVQPERSPECSLPGTFSAISRMLIGWSAPLVIDPHLLGSPSGSCDWFIGKFQSPESLSGAGSEGALCSNSDQKVKSAESDKTISFIYHFVTKQSSRTKFFKWTADTRGMNCLSFRNAHAVWCHVNFEERW